MGNTNTAKTFIITGISPEGKKVRREIIAANKKLALATARRCNVIRRHTHIKEKKDENSHVVF